MIIYIWLYVCVCVCVWKWGLVQAESIWKGRKWWQSVEFWGTLFSDKPRVLVWFERMMVVRIYVLKKEITPRVIPNWIVIPPWWMIVSTGWSIFPIHGQYPLKKTGGAKTLFPLNHNDMYIWNLKHLSMELYGQNVADLFIISYIYIWNNMLFILL